MAWRRWAFGPAWYKMPAAGCEDCCRRNTRPDMSSLNRIPPAALPSPFKDDIDSVPRLTLRA